jgi:hypothetical protein
VKDPSADTSSGGCNAIAPRQFIGVAVCPVVPGWGEWNFPAVFREPLAAIGQYIV